MSTSLGHNVSHTIDSEAQVGNNSTLWSLHGGLKEIVCFGEVMSHCNSGIYYQLILRTFKRRSSAFSANVGVVL